MNILLTSDVFPPNCGGSGWSTFFLARALKTRGAKVKVLAFKSDQKGIKKDEYRGVEVIRFGRMMRGDAALRFIEKKRSLSNFESRIADIISKEKIQAVHAAHFLSAVASAGPVKKAGIPFVITVRDYWPVCLYSTMIFEGKPCSDCSEEKMRKCFIEYNKKYAGVSSVAMPALKKDMQKRQDVLLAADRVVFVSAHLERTVKKIIPGIKSAVMPNGVDMAYVDSVLKTEPGFSISPEYAVFIGKMEKYKGTSALAGLLENKKFTDPVVFIGDGSQRKRLIDASYESGKRAAFLQWTPNDDVLRIMKNAKMLLFPSIWAEPLSRVLLEALAVGLPVVGMATGGTPEIVQEGRNGLLANSEEEFIQKAASLAGDHAKLKTFAKESRRISAERFSQDRLAAEWLGLYEKIFSEKQKTA